MQSAKNPNFAETGRRPSWLARPAMWIWFAAVLPVLIAVCLRYDVFALSGAPPSHEWREDSVNYLRGTDPLQNVPVIDSAEIIDSGGIVTVANEGSTTLVFAGCGRREIVTVQEFEEWGEWVPGNWGGCGMGVELFELAPGKRDNLRVYFQELRRERILGLFTEKDTNRSGLIVMASEGPSLTANFPMILLLISTSATAFSIWLGVRFFNRREPWVKRAIFWFGLLFGPVLYVGSYSPTAMLCGMGYLPHGLRWFYWPVTWMLHHVPWSVREAILLTNWSWG